MTETLPFPPALRTLDMTTSPETTRAYAELTADFNPIHVDPDFAAKTPFGKPIAHGTMALNLVLEAAVRTFGRARPLGEVAIRFVRPVPVSRTIRAGGTLADPSRGTYEVFVEMEDGVRTLEGTLTLGSQGTDATGDGR